MRFELDDILIEQIIFSMENQDGDFLLDTREGIVIDLNWETRDEDEDEDEENDDDDDDSGRYISLPDWTSNDGYRLMEKFTTGLKNPVLRQELTAALNKNKGVFRAFRNILEQYPESEKLWFKYKEEKMKDDVIAWYNSLREEWGLEPVGIEPEDTSSLVLEDFVLREKSPSDDEKAASLHLLCCGNKDGDDYNIQEAASPFSFPGDLCLVAESANGDFAGYICAVFVKPARNLPEHLEIRHLEVQPEYRGMGLGKTLLSKLLEKAGDQTITIDLPAGMDFFSRSLHLESFKPCFHRFVRN